jgi:CheY-like chemotaxis protein
MVENKKLILCVDDDQDFLDSMRMILEEEGFLMETASSAEEGVRRYKELKPACVLVDLMMEEIDSGTSFVKEIKAMGDAPPIFMLSSMGDNLALNTSYTELGLNGVLQKPVDPVILAKTLKTKLK